MPLVSVIIPNYNHAEYLRQRIDSVLKQSCTDFEVIILDDCSTDNSRTIIEQYQSHPKINHIVYNKKNSGSPFKQWLKGISLAKGQWIWIAESDDSAHPLFLDTLLRQAQEHPTAGILYCNSNKEAQTEASSFRTTAEETNSDFNSKAWNYNHLLKGEDANTMYLCRRNIILNASSALIQKHFLQIPALAKMKYYGDWFCYISIATKANIFYCSELLNTFRRHSSSLITTAELKKVKVDCFRILCLLLKQRNINRSETIHHFTTAYLATDLKKEGLFSFLKTSAHYFIINPLLATRIILKILQSKLAKKY